MTKQDELVISHLAAKTCEFHRNDFLSDWDCGFCTTARIQMAELWDYAKNGRIPLAIAVKVMDGQ